MSNGDPGFGMPYVSTCYTAQDVEDERANIESAAAKCIAWERDPDTIIKSVRAIYRKNRAPKATTDLVVAIYRGAFEKAQS